MTVFTAATNLNTPADNGAWLQDYKTIGQYGLSPTGSHLVRRVDSWNNKAGSDKVYIILITQGPNGFHTEAFYGKRGVRLSRNPLYNGKSEVEATRKFTETLAAKQKGGYEVQGSLGITAVPLSNKQLFSERIVWPMGGQPLKVNKKKDIIDNDNWVAEEKSDGVRLTIHLTPTGLRFFSRGAGKDDPTRPLEKTNALGHLKGIIFPDKYLGTIIDSEVLFPGLTSQEISGHINSEDGRDNSAAYFKVFDLIQESSLDITSLEWKYRRTKLTQLMNEFSSFRIEDAKGHHLMAQSANLFDEGTFRLTKYTINNKEDFHNDIVDNGGEGTMWKNINSKYAEGGKPANAWYKWKKEDTADVVILGFTDANEGKYDGLIGAIRYGEYLTEEEIDTLGIKKKHTKHAYINGVSHYLVEIGQCSGMTDAARKDFTQYQANYLGTIIEVEYMQRTKKGALQHPRFVRMRDDKTEEECLYVNQK